MLLLVDGEYGFEMETFEYLNVLQVQTPNAGSVPLPCKALSKVLALAVRQCCLPATLLCRCTSWGLKVGCLSAFGAGSRLP